MSDDFFIVARTFAAPFVSETIERYVEADSPRAAVESIVAQYRDGVGIYAATAYTTADDYHRDRPAAATWWSNKALATRDATSIRSDGPGYLEVDGRVVRLDDPKGGEFV